MIFDGAKKIRVRALLLGTRLDLQKLETTHRLAETSPLVIEAGAHGCVALFRYGGVVLFNVTSLEEVSFLKLLEPLVQDPLKKSETEEIELQYNPDIQQLRFFENKVQTPVWTIEFMQVLAEALAKSISLAHFEEGVRDTFDRIEPWAEALQKRGSGGQQEKDLLKHLGHTILIQHRTVGRAEIQDKPDLLWDRIDLEKYYKRLEQEYDLVERDEALERKLGVIARTAEVILQKVQNDHSVRLEWYVILLIVAELTLSLIEFVGSHFVK